MLKKILIVEDNPNDIKYYTPLFNAENEVNLLFLTPDKKYTKEKLIEIIELFSENLSSKIKEYFVYTKKDISKFLKTTQYDFYIIDSLAGFSNQLIEEIDLPKEKTVFLSSTKPFREFIKKKGYEAYAKEKIDDLIKNHL